MVWKRQICDKGANNIKLKCLCELNIFAGADQTPGIFKWVSLQLNYYDL